VPVPRRFDRRPPDRDLTRINDRIRVPEVRLVGEDGKQIGVIKTADALVYAQERDLDLVEVAPDARPPVCRVLDYSKYKYEQAQKLKAARKHQQQITIREIKFRPKIALNDYETKKGHVRRFLLGKDRVKVTIMFRGREVTHPERGTALLSRLAEELADVGVVEQTPIQDGRNMTMMLAPSKSVLAAAEKAAEAAGSDRQQAAPAAEKDGAKPVKAVSPAAESASDGQPDGASADQDRAEAPEPPEPVPAAAETPEAVSAAATGGGDGQQNGAADTVSPTPSDAPA
jgi:translation initiation factor IF-3